MQSTWFFDVLLSMQMIMMGAVCIPFVYVAMMIVMAGVSFVLLDAAMAVFGLAVRIAGLDPKRTVFISPISLFTFGLHIAWHLITSRMFIITMLCYMIITYLPGAQAVGRETPKMTFSDYFLPGVTRWDAMPYHDFRRVWWVALCSALGNINQEGWSLLQTARNQDIGSPGNPGTPAQTVQSNNRNQRVFGAILQYIEANSYLYHFVSTNFANDGRGLFGYLWEAGHLPYSSEERVKLENEWTEATMSNVGIKYNPSAVYKWAEYVSTLASKLGKSERDKRVKYLAGFPSSFDVLIVAERARGAIGSYTHPANYPAHFPAALAGTPHPHAGQPDIEATATAFYGEWSRMILKGDIKQVPRGFSNRVEDPGSHSMHEHPMHDRQRGYQSTHEQCASSEDEPDDNYAFLARARVTKQMVCGICGGIGHAGKVDGVGQCLTAKLGHRIPHEDLNRMTYPEGYEPPRFSGKSNYYSKSNHFQGKSNHFQGKSNHFQGKRHARIVEPDPILEDEASDEVEDSRRTMHARTSVPRPTRRRFQPKTRKARMVKTDASQSQENPQNSEPVAETDESDHDEHGRLAFAMDNIIIP